MLSTVRSGQVAHFQLESVLFKPQGRPYLLRCLLNPAHPLGRSYSGTEMKSDRDPTTGTQTQPLWAPCFQPRAEEEEKQPLFLHSLTATVPESWDRCCESSHVPGTRTHIRAAGHQRTLRCSHTHTGVHAQALTHTHTYTQVCTHRHTHAHMLVCVYMHVHLCV